MRHLDQGHALELRNDHARLHAVLLRDAPRNDFGDHDARTIRPKPDAAVELAEEERRPHDGLGPINHVILERHLGVVLVHLGDVRALEQLGEEANELFTFGRRALGPMLPEGPLRRLANVDDLATLPEGKRLTDVLVFCFLCA